MITIEKIAQVTSSNFLTGYEHKDQRVTWGFATDLMSEVLALKETPVLLTGLCNIQTIRTCEIAAISVIVFARNKQPDAEMIQLANENHMVLLQCPHSLFRTCGELYENGLRPLY